MKLRYIPINQTDTVNFEHLGFLKENLHLVQPKFKVPKVEKEEDPGQGGRDQALGDLDVNFVFFFFYFYWLIYGVLFVKMIYKFFFLLSLCQVFTGRGNETSETTGYF